MTWAGTAIAVGSATVGAINANQQRKAQQKANQANANISAAQTQYSPWTGAAISSPKFEATPDNTFGAAAQGALGGAMFAKRLNAGGVEGEEDIKIDSEDQAWLDDQGPAQPLGATTPMNYAPAPDNFDLESELRKEEGMKYFGKASPRRSAWG